MFKELDGYPGEFDKMIMTALLTTPTESLAKILDCTEGVENRIKALSKDSRSVDALISKVTTKRYTSSRIRRILTSCLLGIKADLVHDALDSETYAKVLAVNKESMDLISLISQNSSIPLLTRKSDVNALRRTANKCFEIDVLANDLYNLARNENFNENYMEII